RRYRPTPWARKNRMQTTAPSRRRQQTQNIEPEASFRSPLATANRADPPAQPAGMPVSPGVPAPVQPGWSLFREMPGPGCRSAESGLNPACRDQGAFGLVGVNVDEADMQPGEGLAAPHLHGLADHAFAIGQMTAIAAGEGAGNFDILDRIAIGVAQCEG